MAPSSGAIWEEFSEKILAPKHKKGLNIISQLEFLVKIRCRFTAHSSCDIDCSRRRSSERLKAEDARSFIDIIEDKYVHTKFKYLADRKYIL